MLAIADLQYFVDIVQACTWSMLLPNSTCFIIIVIKLISMKNACATAVFMFYSLQHFALTKVVQLTFVYYCTSLTYYLTAGQMLQTLKLGFTRRDRLAFSKAYFVHIQKFQ